MEKPLAVIVTVFCVSSISLSFASPLYSSWDSPDVNDWIIPEWMKILAQIWVGNSRGSDGNGEQLLRFLVTEKIIDYSYQSTHEDLSGILAPNWTKNLADWWSRDRISNSDFFNAMEYLLNKRIIQIDWEIQHT